MGMQFDDNLTNFAISCPLQNLHEMLCYIVKVHKKEEGHDGTHNTTLIALQVDILHPFFNPRPWFANGHHKLILLKLKNLIPSKRHLSVSPLFSVASSNML